MGTTRLLPVSPSMHCAGGAVSVTGGLPQVPGSGLGGDIPACNGADPPMNRMTDRCKNITLPQTSFAGCNYKVNLGINDYHTCLYQVRIRLSTLALKLRGDVIGSPKRGISGSTKRTYVLQKLGKKVDVRVASHVL